MCFSHTDNTPLLRPNLTKIRTVDTYYFLNIITLVIGLEFLITSSNISSILSPYAQLCFGISPNSVSCQSLSHQHGYQRWPVWRLKEIKLIFFCNKEMFQRIYIRFLNFLFVCFAIIVIMSNPFWDHFLLHLAHQFWSICTDSLIGTVKTR